MNLSGREPAKLIHIAQLCDAVNLFKSVFRSERFGDNKNNNICPLIINRLTNLQSFWRICYEF